MTRKQAFKNALCLYITIYGTAIYFGGATGLQRYILVTVQGNSELVKLMGIAIAGFGLAGFFSRAKPIYIWLVLSPYLVYASMATYGALHTPNATPSGVWQYVCPLMLTFAYLWERTDV